MLWYVVSVLVLFAHDRLPAMMGGASTIDHASGFLRMMAVGADENFIPDGKDVGGEVLPQLFQDFCQCDPYGRHAGT